MEGRMSMDTTTEAVEAAKEAVEEAAEAAKEAFESASAEALAASALMSAMRTRSASPQRLSTAPGTTCATVTRCRREISSSILPS